VPDVVEPTSSPLKERLTSVFRYLKALNQLRNPIPKTLSHDENKVLRLDKWPKDPRIVIHRGDRVRESASDDGKSNAPMAPVITITRAVRLNCPKPPSVLHDWIEPNWYRIDSDIKTIASRDIPNEDEVIVTEAFSDDTARVGALETWSKARAEWVKKEQANIEARKLYEDVRGFWTAFLREVDEYELVLADGMLQVPSSGIKYPVLFQEVSLEFDSKGSEPKLMFVTGTNAPELNRPLLREVCKDRPRLLNEFQKQIEDDGTEPLGGETTVDFLKRLVHGLFSDGEFLERPSEGNESTRPEVWREPVIFRRPRLVGLHESLDDILEDLADEDSVPSPVLDKFVGGGDAADHGANGEGDADADISDIDILYSKPANAEQYKIATHLATAGAVLVQGPPGTGKTHTTANLLGHLLAQGKRVLVTAHTSKALRVLRDEIDPSLQSLCLSVVGDDAKSRTELELAATDITDRVAKVDEAGDRAQAEVLRKTRRRRQEHAAELQRQILVARQSETTELVIAGLPIRPIDAAKIVGRQREHDNWIPSPLEAQQCPLTPEEVRNLYANNASIPPEDIDHLSTHQPDRDKLLSDETFESYAREQTDAEDAAGDHQAEYWERAVAIPPTADILAKLHASIIKAADVLVEDQKWLREVLYAGLKGGDHRGAWEDVLESTKKLLDTATTDQRFIQLYDPKFDEDGRGGSGDERVALLDNIVTFIERGGAISWKMRLLHSSWHQLIRVSWVNGQKPTTLDHFRALRAKVRLPIARKRFLSFWRRSVETHGGPPTDGLGDFPERKAEEYSGQIRSKLDWAEQHWNPLIQQLIASGFRWDRWLEAVPAQPGPHGQLERIKMAVSDRFFSVIGAKVALVSQEELRVALEAQRTYLTEFPQSSIAHSLLDAQRGWDADQYRNAFRTLGRINGLQPAYDERAVLLQKLQSTAREWARRIERRDPPHDRSEPPGGGDAEQAWRWRLMHEELERRANVSISDLVTELEEVEAEVLRLAAQIVEKESWVAQKKRTSPSQQRALNAFVQTMRKIGRGLGSRQRVTKLKQEARKALTEARTAVPVWIMPLGRVYETFSARHTEKFDVVIIDEASQADITALAAMYLGNESVIVGDREQVSPEAVGQIQTKVEDLIGEYLTEIPYNRLWDGQTSVYDLAAQSFEHMLSLWEHFRSVPDIIQFSNQLSYSGKIRPLRDPSSSPVYPHVVEHVVTDGSQNEQGNVNEREAEEVASLVVACINDPAYEKNNSRDDKSRNDTSFGVIAMLGSRQALEIQRLLERELGPEKIDRHRVLCGNPAQFQGDERDVMFLSLVHGPPSSGVHRMLSEGPRGRDQKRYNVAASRARNQLWVVHSLDPNTQLKSGDLRRRLIEHARNPQGLMDQEGQTESEFERRVLSALTSRGFRVIPQWKVGAAYRIDLVVVDENDRLAVECDGEAFHTAENLRADMERQAILERLDWKFERIRGSVFFRDEDRAMQPVFEKLKRLGIEPIGELPPEAEPSDLLLKLRREAEKLRRKWRDPNRVDEEVSENVEHIKGTSGEGDSDAQPARADRFGPRAAYVPFEGPAGPVPYILNTDKVADGLEKIVKSEGPMTVRRAVDVYLKGFGGFPAVKLFSAFTRKAFELLIFENRIVKEPGRQTGKQSSFFDVTVRVAGTPSVHVRTRGPREFLDIPQSELLEVARRLAETEGSEFASTANCQAVLQFYDVEPADGQTNDALKSMLSAA